MLDTQQDLVITRMLRAPREKVWRAWSDAGQLAQWWGPKGCTIRVIKLDFRPGGIFHYSMQFQPGHEMFGRFIYREIAAPERIVFINSFSDIEGGITRAPFPQLKDSWPLEVHNTMTLIEDNGHTHLTLRGRPINASEAEAKTFIGMFDSMKQGFSGTFDKLDDYLTRN